MRAFYNWNLNTKCIVLYDDKFIITVTFRDEPIVVMTSEEAADVARLGSDINSLAPPKDKEHLMVLFVFSVFVRRESKER